MLTSITPLGERGRNSCWGVTFAWFLLGAVAGGATIGLVLGLLGEGLQSLVDAPADGRALAIAAAVAAGVAWESGIVRRSLPTTLRQVNAYWLGRYRGWFVGVGFGAQLGLGVGTIVSTALVYSALAAAVLVGSTASGLVIGGAFGLARGLALAPAAWVTTPERLAHMRHSVYRHERSASLAAITTSTLAMLVLATVSIRGGVS